MGVGNSKGIALLEAAVAASIALPIALSAIVVMALVHDRGAVQPIPEAVLAGQRNSVMTWHPDRFGSGVRVDVRAIEDSLKEFVRQSIASAKVHTLRLERVSAKACYWVYRVNQSSGAVVDVPVRSECFTEGDLSEQRALQGALDERHKTAHKYVRGIPLLADDPSAGFLGEVVLWGVVVGGEFSGLPLLYDGELIAGAAVEVPRREVTL